ncbi:DMT family transporter [Chromohalobacter canadensis]|uniref:DMT family transporter n=1 Tax=Chromohalobacter canadensis TaxID=141389 RepID=UPI0021BF3766|nr:DMT family transporter [Chromohalobacter canadensis]MCT8468910.1 DMT family transporter [Chromohalobacter canadensis]MCT8472900.1 DMT family transporter [Chromohalobacter canadensis]MCT8500352.1 DMT family transporter [Chromohalobacter canadensis]
MASTRTSAGLLAGLLTVTLWASLPVLRNLISLPPMLTAAVAMGAAALMARCVGQRGGSSAGAKSYRDWTFWLMGVGGLTGALYFYFAALGKGDPAKITLVTYLWPLGFMLVADWLAGRGFQARTLLGAAVAFSGLIPLVLSSGQGEPTSVLGYAQGVASGVSWIMFSLYLQGRTTMTWVDYKHLFAGAAIASWGLHSLFEAAPSQTTAMDWGVAALIGVGPYGLAFVTWGYALLRSSSTLLGVLTYFVPIISSLFLILAGRAAFSLPLIIAFVGVLGSAAITQMKSQRHGAASA